VKIYISVDMEGIAGICHFRQEADDTARFRKNMQQQVEWVIEGILASPRANEVTEICVADSHGAGRNLGYDLCEMDERVTLISGVPRPEYMMPALDPSFDVVFLVGYHAGVGEADANMNHSYSASVVHDIRVNGVYMNEATLNAAYAAYHGIPVGLVVGESGLQKQLLDDGMMPWVEYVKTKDSLSFLSAKFRSPAAVRRETHEKVAAALAKDLASLPLYKLDAPYELRVEFNMCPQLDRVALIPGARLVDGRTAVLRFDDYRELFNAVMAVCFLAGGAFPNDR